METILFQDDFEYRPTSFENNAPFIGLAAGVAAIPLKKARAPLILGGIATAAYGLYRKASAVPRSPMQFWLTLPEGSSFQIYQNEIIKRLDARNILHVAGRLTSATHLYLWRHFPKPIDVYGRQITLGGLMVVRTVPPGAGELETGHVAGLGYVLVPQGDMNRSGNGPIGLAGNTWTFMQSDPFLLSNRAEALAKDRGVRPDEVKLTHYYIFYVGPLPVGSSLSTGDFDVYLDDVRLTEVT